MQVLPPNPKTYTSLAVIIFLKAKNLARMFSKLVLIDSVLVL